jgi:hypothetical protein
LKRSTGNPDGMASVSRDLFGVPVRIDQSAVKVSTVARRSATRRVTRVLLLALAAMPLTPDAITASAAQTPTASDVAVKAAFVYNFAKFAEWPTRAAHAPIIVCVVGDDAIAAALVDTVRGKNINGHALEIWRPQEGTTWRTCSVLFIAAAESRQSASDLGGIRTMPILTVSDGKGFSQAGGIIELYVEGGRMRFAINVDAAERSGLQLSSRLLGLAKVIRDSHVQ